MCPDPTAGAQQFQAAHTEPQICRDSQQIPSRGIKTARVQKDNQYTKEKVLYLVFVVFQPEERVTMQSNPDLHPLNKLKEVNPHPAEHSFLQGLQLYNVDFSSLDGGYHIAIT